MKIVIDIDDNLYARLFDNGIDNYDDAVDMAKAIRKGTPFPKGHGKLTNHEWIDFLTEQFDISRTSAKEMLFYHQTYLRVDFYIFEYLSLR